MISDLYILPLIFIISTILTMVGLGGGILYAPLFLLLDFSVPLAVSTSLLLNGTAALSAAITYFRKRLIDFKIALPLLIASTLSAPVGAILVTRINMQLYLSTLAFVMTMASLWMIFGKRPGLLQISSSLGKLGIGSFVGIIVGFIAGLLGIGGGIFIVPLLVLLTGVDAKTAAATSIFIVVFPSFSGFLAHAGLHELNTFVLKAAIVAFLGAQLGSRIMVKKLQGKTIKRLFAFVLLIFVAKIIQKSL